MRIRISQTGIRLPYDHGHMDIGWHDPRKPRDDAGRELHGQIVVPSGEVRPRVRSPKVWSITLQQQQHTFGWVNYLVLFGYLTTMVMIGVYFTRKNKSTDDFFRGGKEIPWWAAGCSIFATMLSSLTFTGVPSKAFAQDWVYARRQLHDPCSRVHCCLSLPCRSIVASMRRVPTNTLELRFNRVVRLFGSVSFSVFHLFRMAVVMSLTGLGAGDRHTSDAKSISVDHGVAKHHLLYAGAESRRSFGRTQSKPLYSSAGL